MLRLDYTIGWATYCTQLISTNENIFREFSVSLNNVPTVVENIENNSQ